MILVVGKLTLGLEEVQSSEILFMIFWKHAHDLESRTTLSHKRRMANTVLNKHEGSPSILSKHVSSSSMYKVNNAGERGHPC